MRILYFAWLKEKIGLAEEEVSPPSSVATVADLLSWLAERSPGHALALSKNDLLRCAINQSYARFDQPVNAGDEVAFFPPVTGG